MPEEPSLPSQTDRLMERLDYLEYALREQIARLYRIEQQLGLAPPASGPAPSPEATVEVETGAKAPEAKPELPQPPPVVDKEPPVRPDAPPPRHPRPVREWRAFSVAPSAEVSERRSDLEARIGGSWFNRIGIAAILLGVAFFLKYAFDNQWIGPRTRVIMGILAGIGFLAGGEHVRARGYRHYAQGLSGGGIGILYLSIFAAFAFYSLIGQLPAFLLMMLVTTTAVLLAVRYDALPIAVLGLVGGFLTPILLSTGKDNQIGLFSYIALLDVGVLAVAYFKRWRSLDYLGFVGTVLIFAGWLGEWYVPEKLSRTIFFLTLFFIIFSLLAVFHNVINRRLVQWPEIGLILANSVFYFTTSYRLLDEKYESYLGLFAVLVSAFYLSLGYLTYSRDREDRYLILTFLGLASLFLMLAVPIQLDQHWVTMGWALEGVILTWIGLQASSRATRYAAMIVFVVALLHWFGVDVRDFAFRENEVFTPLLNRRAASCAVMIASLVAAAWLYRRFGERVEEQERLMLGGACALGANVLAVTLLSLDASDYFEQAKALARKQGESATELWYQRQGWEKLRQIENTKQLILSLIWSFYGAVALLIGILRRIGAVRFAALVLLALAVLKVLFVDAGFYAAPWHMLVFNRTFAAFALLIIALASSSWFYARAEGIKETERKIAASVLIAVTNLLAIIALSLEASGYFEVGRQGSGEVGEMWRDLRLARQLSLSVIWAVYGGVMLVVGIWRNGRLLRVMSLLLLGLTIIKVFLIDLASLDKLYRIISFVVLGAILLAVSFIYQQYQQRSAEP